MLSNLLNRFIEKIRNDEIQLYNEAGLQFELGYFLRHQGLELYFEYNIGNLNIRIADPLKKEMDLYLVKKSKSYCIEIKFPTKGAFPRRMTQSVLDIFFLKQLINSGFKEGYFVFFSQLTNFTEGKKNERIYSYFREKKVLNHFNATDIPEFMLKKDKQMKLFQKLLEETPFTFNKPIEINFSSINNRGKGYHFFILQIT